MPSTFFADAIVFHYYGAVQWKCDALNHFAGENKPPTQKPRIYSFTHHNFVTEAIFTLLQSIDSLYKSPNSIYGRQNISIDIYLKYLKNRLSNRLSPIIENCIFVCDVYGIDWTMPLAYFINTSYTSTSTTQHKTKQSNNRGEKQMMTEIENKNDNNQSTRQSKPTNAWLQNFSVR